MTMFVQIKHPEWLKYSSPGKTLQMFHEGKLPKSIAGWMIVVSLKQPLRAVYGSDLRAASCLFLDALREKICGTWMDFRFKHNLLSAEEQELKREVLSDLAAGEQP